MFPNNKQNKQGQTKKNEIKESYLNYTIMIKHTSCFIFYFSLGKLAKHTSKNVFALFSTSNLLLVCLSQSHHKRGTGV